MPVTLQEAATVYGLKDRELLKLADPNKRPDNAIVDLMAKYPAAFPDMRKASKAEADEGWRNISSLRARCDREAENERALARIAAKYGDKK